MNLIEHVYHESLLFLDTKTKTERKKIGQFITPPETAQYMANMFKVPNKQHLEVLDPGAGTGMLTAAIIDRLQKHTSIKSVSITCYETNNDVISTLTHNLKYIKENSKIKIEYQIINENYITSQKDCFNAVSIGNKAYDIIIGNPPYQKISKDADEAASMPIICYGAPNMYFLFLGMSIFNLKDDGEIVYIIPRSWTSGAYFRKFRDYLCKKTRIKQIHLFVSRDKVFENEEVLQETIIIKLDKSSAYEDILITSSKSNNDFENITTFYAPYNIIVNGSENYVYLITNENEMKTLSILNKLKNTLPSIGLKMHTGLTVDFRNRELLHDDECEGSSPILYSQHIKSGRVVFPIEKDCQYILTDQKGLLQKNKNYLLCKRFTAKEEKRRLQCGIYLSEDYPKYKNISTQNKLNFIDSKNTDMSKELTFGLYALFNSTLYDNYYRILNGSTQVNSTEINTMPVPPINVIENFGNSLLEKNDLTTESCDRILEDYFNGQ